MTQQPKLPKSLKVTRRGAIAIVTLARPEKRNALNDTTVLGLETFFETLPAGSRGIFVGGGGSVRLPRIIGVSRMIDLMLTGRTYGAEEGQALGISHYLVEPGEGLAKGIEIAKRIATNSPATNFAILNVLPRIAEQDRASGYVTESLIAAIAQGNDEAKKRIKAFLEKRAAKVERK